MHSLHLSVGLHYLTQEQLKANCTALAMKKLMQNKTTSFFQHLIVTCMKSKYDNQDLLCLKIFSCQTRLFSKVLLYITNGHKTRMLFKVFSLVHPWRISTSTRKLCSHTWNKHKHKELCSHTRNKYKKMKIRSRKVDCVLYSLLMLVLQMFSLVKQTNYA